MGTEQLLIFRIELDLKKLKKSKVDIKDLRIKARLERLEKINKPMFEDLNKQLDDFLYPIFNFEENLKCDKNIAKFNSLFKN